MNIGGVLLLSFMGSLGQSAAAQADYAVSYTQLFSLITWPSVGLMGAAAGLPVRISARANRNARTRPFTSQPDSVDERGRHRPRVLFLFRYLLGAFGMTEPVVVNVGVQLLKILSVSGFTRFRRSQLHRRSSGNRRHEEPALYIDHFANSRPARLLLRDPGMEYARSDPYLVPILLGHFTRCTLSVLRFTQGHWRAIKVEG